MMIRNFQMRGKMVQDHTVCPKIFDFYTNENSRTLSIDRWEILGDVIGNFHFSKYWFLIRGQLILSTIIKLRTRIYSLRN